MAMFRGRKHVTNEFLQTLPEPEGELDRVVRVTALRGGSTFEVQESSGEMYLVRLPSKFRKVIWIKRGSHLIVERISEEEIEGDKVVANVKHILDKEGIKHLKKKNLFPFTDDSTESKEEDDADASTFVNNNRRKFTFIPSSDEEDDDDEDDDEKDEDEDEGPDGVAEGNDDDDDDDDHHPSSNS
jgi:probable RNA-binding protein EIF1AD